MSVCAPNTKSHEILIPSVMVIGVGTLEGDLGNASGTHKRDPRKLSYLFHHVKTQGENRHLSVRKESLTKSLMCWYLNLRHSNLNCCLSYPSMIVFHNSLNRLRQVFISFLHLDFSVSIIFLLWDTINGNTFFFSETVFSLP